MGLVGIEPTAFALSRQHSTSELQAQELLERTQEFCFFCIQLELLTGATCVDTQVSFVPRVLAMPIRIDSTCPPSIVRELPMPAKPTRATNRVPEIEQFFSFVLIHSLF